jgi:ribonuclease R
LNLKKQFRTWRDTDAGQAREAGRYERPIPSRQFLLDTLNELAAPTDGPALARALAIKDTPLRLALDKRLEAMVRDGQLLRNRRGQYLITDRTGLITGTVVGHKDGFGFLAPDDGGDDLFLPPAEMRSVLHGDRIAARVIGRDARGRREAGVVEVLEHRTRQVAGRFRLERGVGFVEPDNRRISQRVVIPAAARGAAKDADLVVAELTKPPSRHADAVGRITRVLPQGNLVDTAIDLAIASHQLPHEFGADAIRDARSYGRRVTEAMSAGRLDLRDIPLVTIDGEDARDFDDAVYATPERGGWRLVVAIADVSHYVEPETALDADAQERATSVYFPGRVLPMLPEALSNELCSLMPEVDRLCLACDMHVSSTGRVTRAQFKSAVMRSAARLTYTQVAAAVFDRQGSPRAELKAVLEPLSALKAVYGALRASREARGALDFESGEVRLVIDDGRVSDIRVVQRTDAHRLIEECMIAANVEAARFLKRHRMPGLYRVHPRPDEERMVELKRFLATRGLPFETEGVVDPKRLARLLTQVRQRPDAATLESTIIRSLAQAVYQPENIGHFGLALGEYAHFTSPIRRYPDLLVHRAIRHVLAGGSARDFAHSKQEVERLGVQCSARERRADEATRDVVAYLKCEFMRDRVGETFPGIVTGVTDFGLFVQLSGLQVDGLVHVANLGAEYFRYDTQRRALIGERTHRAYALGDEISVRVSRVDPSERKIDLELADAKGRTTARASRGSGRRRGR